MNHFANLQKPLKLGNITLKNRIVLSSMTRNRAIGTIPNENHVEYYTQRSGAGLLLTEGTFISPQGFELPSIPGIWNDEQVEAWKKVVDGVHANGSYIFSQLWHIGRVAHPLHQSGQPTLAPSNVGAKGGKFRLLAGAPGYVSDPKPIADPRTIVELYRTSSKLAKKAGFDGVELHAANGYLPHQFIESHSNTRTDEWGGSAQKRSRFVLETIRALIEEMGDSKRVGIKLSPANGYNDMGDPKDVLLEEYTFLIKELDKLNVAYIHLVREPPVGRGIPINTPINVLATFASLTKNVIIIANGGYEAREADSEIGDENNNVQAVSFGALFITNPDLPSRIWNNRELNLALDPSVFYFPPEGKPISAGYTDYPISENWKKSSA